MAKKEPVAIKYPPSPSLARLFARVVKLARCFPGVEESRSYGTPAIKVKGKFMARLRSEAEGGLAIVCAFDERQMLMDGAPEVFYITDHYADYEIVLIDLGKVAWDMMPEIVEQAWRAVATPRLLAQYEAGSP